ncbi:major facilitator superfamily domain-containing protein [Gymnopilus junonius]|uniref:Major facilitator superfamily domain-containing protein n=1 Tax=Gymnopilus junonius TaxID=109634 RepID=A0A9P5NUT7_GYMJU|nr:major facilitator superfamily domain-containing protein [Gymnopilus junonius]
MTAPEGGYSEESSLLDPHPPRMRRPISRTRSFIQSLSRDAHPFWLIPVVLIMSMSRGVTMSPRIQVYRAIACRALSKDEPGVTDLVTFVNGCEDAEVQARAAKIQAAVVTTMSVLSAISTGFWSRLGDAHGRKLILSTFLIGALSMEAVFVLVMRPDSLFGRRAERFILVGPVIEGFVGGLSTFNGVVHAYISDCTRHGSRSKIFSTVQGMVFVGLAIGPWLGGYFFPAKGYNDGFFYTSIGIITFTLLYVIFVCPESLKHSERTVQSRTQDDLSFKTSPLLVVRRLIMNFISALLLPISMFTPLRIPGSSRYNYNMTLVGLSMFLYIVSTGVYSAKYLYAQHVYSWTTAQLGYYMSTLWITRALNLLVFLPILLSYLKPKSTSSSGSTPNAHDISAELNFDRYLAAISLAVDGFADSLVALTSHNSQPLYYALSCLSSFTSGGNPALHSLGAVCLHACGRGSEVGALFGALGVLSAIGHIVSPSIYALTYGSSVAYYPEAIFALAACILYSVVFFLSRINPAEEDIALVHTPIIGENYRSRSPSTRDYMYQTVSNDEDDVALESAGK